MSHPHALPQAPRRRPFAFGASALAAAFALAGGPAAAFEFDTGNPDLAIRFDNTVRLNLAQRVEARDSKIGNSVLADEGDYSFDKGDWVAQRFDLLSEFDVVYRKRHGARLSATAWYDAAYDGTSNSNPNAPYANIPSYTNHEYSHTVKRLYRGGTGELMDAFVFGAVDLGEVPVRAKLGRHTVYWGESLFLGGHLHSVSYAQVPLDLQKGFATPGTEAKELFRPLGQLSLQAQLADTLSLSAQYLFEWEAARYPEGGTYLGPVDFVFNGPDRQFLSGALGFATRGQAAEPKQAGEWGLAARWSPAWLDGTLGVYARRFSDKLPQTLLTAAGPGTSVYNLVYAGGVDLYGVSLAKNVGGVSLGAEFSQRRNTPLNAQVLGVAPGLPGRGETKGPRGDTQHALLNLLGSISATPLFDSASWAAEIQWSRWTRVRSGENLFNALGFAPCNNKDRFDGCATKNYTGVGFSFTPSWFQVLPGVDLSLPFSYALGIDGNAAVVFGGNQGLGNYSVGLSADVQQKYRFDLKYVDYLGYTKDNGTAVTSTNGLTTFLKDRGFVSLTFKTSF
ncbi:MAG: DUF1302 domain-containing protein [Rubrivivax sp.]